MLLFRERLLASLPFFATEALGKEEKSPKSVRDRHVTRMIAFYKTAVEAATREAAACGFTPSLLTSALTGEAATPAETSPSQRSG